MFRDPTVQTDAAAGGYSSSVSAGPSAVKEEGAWKQLDSKACADGESKESSDGDEEDDEDDGDSVGGGDGDGDGVPAKEDEEEGGAVAGADIASVADGVLRYWCQGTYHEQLKKANVLEAMLAAAAGAAAGAGGGIYPEDAPYSSCSSSSSLPKATPAPRTALVTADDAKVRTTPLVTPLPGASPFF